MLIVEDQDVMRRMLVEYVQSAYPDAAIMEAADGARALALCRSRRPRLVLMDVALPDANGIELTAQIREMLPETEVIIVSQHAVATYVERAHAGGRFRVHHQGQGLPGPVTHCRPSAWSWAFRRWTWRPAMKRSQSHLARPALAGLFAYPYKAIPECPAR